MYLTSVWPVAALDVGRFTQPGKTLLISFGVYVLPLKPYKEVIASPSYLQFGL
jgi:hypothetical protein